MSRARLLSWRVPQTFNLADVLLGAIGAHQRGVYTAIPGRVESFNAARMTVDVQPLVKTSYENELGDRVPESLPVVPSVPLVFPGGGGFRIYLPIAQGDTVLLLFASCSLDRWLEHGGEVDPEDDRRNTLSDAVAIPGLLDAPTAILKTAPIRGMSIGSDGDGPKIVITSTEIEAGGTQAVVLQDDLDTFTDALDVAILAVSTTPDAETALTALKTALGAWTATSTYLKGG